MGLVTIQLCHLANAQVDLLPGVATQHVARQQQRHLQQAAADSSSETAVCSAPVIFAGYHSWHRAVESAVTALDAGGSLYRSGAHNPCRCDHGLA